MREIKFRGFHKTSKAWCYGSLDLTDENGPKIRTSNAELSWSSRFVIPETVGQYTGLKDKNGVEIYEGDVLRMADYPEWLAVVVFHKGSFCYKFTHSTNDVYSSFCLDNENKDCEVISNIYESPELLEAKV